MVRVITVDDHELIREGVKKILRSAKDIHVVGEAEGIGQALALIRRDMPDIVILDVSLPGYEGTAGLTEIHANFPELRILLLSMYSEERCAIRAIQAGAAGYVTKSMAADELIRAIRRIHAEGSYVSSRLAELLASEVRSQNRAAPRPALSKRELDIVTLIAAGKRTKQIAADLGISISSVNTYRLRLFRKMGWVSNAAVVRYAIEHGMVL